MKWPIQLLIFYKLPLITICLANFMLGPFRLTLHPLYWFPFYTPLFWYFSYLFQLYLFITLYHTTLYYTYTKKLGQILRHSNYPSEFKAVLPDILIPSSLSFANTFFLLSLLSLSFNIIISHYICKYRVNNSLIFFSQIVEKLQRHQISLNFLFLASVFFKHWILQHKYNHY